MDCVACFKHLNNLKPDFGFGLFLFCGSLKEVFKVVVFLFLFGAGLRLFHVTWHYVGFVCALIGQLCGLRKGLSSKSFLDFEKIEFCECKLLKLSKTCDEHESMETDETNFVVSDESAISETMKKMENSSWVVDSDDDFDSGECIDYVDGGKEEDEWCDEDEEFDVLVLRKMIKFERNEARKARLELEKERVAAASAAEEAMAMILRLQNEKSLIEREAKHYRRVAEAKQLHDKNAIESLHWIVLMHQHENSLKNVDNDDGSPNAKYENESKGGLFSSLDMVSSPWRSCT